MSIVESISCITKPWKNRNKLETYVYNSTAKLILSECPHLVPSEDLTQMVRLGVRTRHKLASYGSFLRIIIDTLYQSKGAQPTQIMIDRCLNTAHHKISLLPKSDQEDPADLLFEAALKILRDELKTGSK
jgi:hypothetical protein